MGLSWKNIWQSNFFYEKDHCKLFWAPENTFILERRTEWVKSISSGDPRAGDETVSTPWSNTYQSHFWIWVRFLLLYFYLFIPISYIISILLFSFPPAFPGPPLHSPISFIPPVSLQKEPGLPGIATLTQAEGTNLITTWVLFRIMWPKISPRLS